MLPLRGLQWHIRIKFGDSGERRRTMGMFIIHAGHFIGREKGFQGRVKILFFKGDVPACRLVQILRCGFQAANIAGHDQ